MLICPDVVDKLEWFQFEQVQSKGFVAACRVNEFAANVPELPRDVANGIDKLLVETEKQ